MTTITVSPEATMYVRASVSETIGGSASDPTADDVFLAFLASGTPQSGDWLTAEWETVGSTYFARVLVGPDGGEAVAEGRYDIWVRIDAALETVVQRVGALIVSDVGTQQMASAEEFAAETGSEIDSERADTLLQLATAAIQGYCAQTFFYVADDEVVLDGMGFRTLLLPEMPVVDVSEVTEDAVALTEGTDYVWYRNGSLIRGGYGPPWGSAIWSPDRQNVLVTYSHGYLDIPLDLKLACIQVAQNLTGVVQGDVVSKSIGTLSVTYAQTSSAIASQQAVLGLYRMRILR